MRKYIAAAVLSATLLVASSATHTTVSAQGTKDKAKVKVAPTGGGHIEIHKSDKNGKYYFGVRDADGKYLGGSTTPHDTEKETRDAIETFRKVIASAKVVVKDHKDTKETKKKTTTKD